jgi:hypothetical protein
LAILLLADSEGYLLISVPGLAKEAHVSIDECRDALARLEAPDPESQHREEEGRRIIRIGGEVPAWHIVNYSYYRSLRDEDLRREYMREYQKDYRRKKKAAKLSSVNPGKPRLAQAEEEAEEEEEKTSTKTGGRFAPPTLQELTAYIKEKNYHFSSEAFLSYYESNGWRVGRNPMKSWQAACSTWETKESQRGFPLVVAGKKEVLCRDCKQPMTKVETMEGSICRTCRLDHGV